MLGEPGLSKLRRPVERLSVLLFREREDSLYRPRGPLLWQEAAWKRATGRYVEDRRGIHRLCSTR